MIHIENVGLLCSEKFIGGEDCTPHRYSYSYDKANRLQSGMGSGGYGESLTYRAGQAALFTITAAWGTSCRALQMEVVTAEASSIIVLVALRPMDK